MIKQRIICKYSSDKGVCGKNATCGFKPSSRKVKRVLEYCKLHMKEGMEPLSQKTCNHSGCHLVPNFALPGNKPQFCRQHKSTDMIDVKMQTSKCKYQQIDSIGNVVYPCKKQCNFGDINGTPMFCRDHKQQSMVNVKIPYCNHEGCVRQPTHGYPNLKPQFCAAHSPSDMGNVTVLKCNNGKCKTAANSKYQGMCARCFYDTHPDDPRTRNHKIRESHVVQRVIQHINNKFPIITDKAVGRSRKRPDLMIVQTSMNLIVEIDENQHKDYDPQGETQRIQLIHKDLKYKPLVIIRFNPDNYKLGEIRHKSAFVINPETGAMEPEQVEFEARMAVLTELVNSQLSYIPTDATPKVHRLYYDQI